MAKNKLKKIVQWFNVFFSFNSYTALGNNNNWCVGIGTGCVAEEHFSSQYVFPMIMKTPIKSLCVFAQDFANKN